jgi:hypothetical protein
MKTLVSSGPPSPANIREGFPTLLKGYDRMHKEILQVHFKPPTQNITPSFILGQAIFGIWEWE